MTIEDISQLTKDYDRFDDGRIDYTNEKVCYVLNCVVVYSDKVLLTRRGNDVIAYPNTLNGISGFIDKSDKSIRDQAINELTEELRMPPDIISNVIVSEPFVQIDNNINREWHVFAVLIEVVEKFQPITNWENKSANWYTIKQAKKSKLMPGFLETLNIALALRRI